MEILHKENPAYEQRRIGAPNDAKHVRRPLRRIPLKRSEQHAEGVDLAESVRHSSFTASPQSVVGARKEMRRGIPQSACPCQLGRKKERSGHR